MLPYSSTMNTKTRTAPAVCGIVCREDCRKQRCRVAKKRRGFLFPADDCRVVDVVRIQPDPLLNRQSCRLKLRTALRKDFLRSLSDIHRAGFQHQNHLPALFQERQMADNNLGLIRLGNILIENICCSRALRYQGR